MEGKIIIILGQTAVGKSDFAVRLAKKINGEVISADSRQVYAGLNIGTGKITKKEMRGVRHHLLDVVDPRRQCNVAEYVGLARKAINDIYTRGKVPIICGGTGFYIEALLGNVALPAIPPNPLLRKKLEKKSTEMLYATLKKLDPKRARAIDRHNPRRLIRAIEVARSRQGGTLTEKRSDLGGTFNVLKIGLMLPNEEIKRKITIRLFARIGDGMIQEVKKLHAKGISWKRMEKLGLEYYFLARHLQGKLSKEEMTQQLEKAIWHYAKRQKTWFKRDKTIKWFTPSSVEGFKPKDYKKIEKAVKKFLT